MAQTRRRETPPKTEPVERKLDPQDAPYPETPLGPAGPRVSVILIGHNRAGELRRAIQALERSTDRERLEILVVDCGSRDDSPQLDVDYPSVTMLRLPHNFGATKAMNIGTRTAKGEILFYLSPDVEVAPDTVASLADRLEAEGDAAAVCPLLVDTQGRTVSKIQELPTSQSLAAACRGTAEQVEVDLSQESVAVEYPGIEALMVRRQFVKSMNYFDERYGQFWADADLAAQVRRAQKRILLFPSIRATRHPGPDPLAGDPLLAADCASGAAAFLGKYSGFGASLSFRIGAILRALARFDLRQLAALVSGQKFDGSHLG